MLVEFTVGNYLSFKDKKTLSLEAASITEYMASNVIRTKHCDLLKSTVIYGANSSGKSNLIKAISTMQHIVLHSVEGASTKKIDVVPFLLSTKTEQAPSFFEMIFLIDKTLYRYGFEAYNTNIASEWLFETQGKTEKPLFIRENNAIEVMQGFAEGENMEEKTRDNVLFLSVVDQFNGKTAKKIFQWFNQLVPISGLSHEMYKEMTFSVLTDDNTQDAVSTFFDILDLGFDEISWNIEPTKMTLSGKEYPYIEKEIKTKHHKYDEKNEMIDFVEFDMQNQESSGTNKIFNISGSVINVLNKGGVLVIDELDASLHPLLTLALTKLFNSTAHNPQNAQLIFATHDTNLLHYGNYRRDQIYFVEKNSYGASDLYSLVEYKEDDNKKVRKDRSFEKDYIQGRYGAIPFIGDFSKLTH
ncbi:hypothetical protein FACS189430_01780 [Bacteroidia bacterium]|nr:hypothetical protein FACS189430_01780 [Bacteroidia bacterium]